MSLMAIKLGLAVLVVWWLTKRDQPGPSGNVDEGDDGFSVYVPGGGRAFDPSSLNARQPGTP